MTYTLFFSLALAFLGGDKRDRTADPLLAKQVLSQLSYTPNLSIVNCQLLIVQCAL